MALQFSVAIQDARNDQTEIVVGTAPIMRIRSGPPPANCAAADTGTVLSTLTLPVDWMNNSSGGVKTKAGVWEDATADASGTPGHFRIYDSGDTTCHHQGTVSGPGGGGDMELDAATITAGQKFTVATYTITDGNA